MAYGNVPISRQQGGSELSVESGGSVNYATGARQDLQSGVTRLNGGAGIYFGTATPHNSLSASPGSLYVRSDGTNSNLYVNVASGVSGETWKSACIVD